MSDRDRRWLWILVALVLFAAYTEADSWFWRSQIRDLQHRVGQLEEQVRR